MAKKEVIEGNIILRTEELHQLRKAIVDRFATLTGMPIHFPERIFNSNLENYNDLKASIINNKVKFDLKSNKPLAVLFHTSKSNKEGSVTFRKKFINSLYEYAHGVGRDEFLATHKSAFVSSKERMQLKNIEGYWECYYDKKGRFAERLREGREAAIGKLAYWISGDSIHNAAVQFYQSKNTGKGSVEAKGTNLVFRLENDINSEPQFVFMNCGRDIENSTVHFERMVGCFLHLDASAASPKVGKCVMFYLPNKNWKLDTESERDKFDGEETVVFHMTKEEDDRVLNDVKAFFFEEDTNTITANITDYTRIINKPKLGQLNNPNNS